MGEEGLVFSPEPFLLDPSIPNLENLPTQGEGSARPILNPTSLQPPVSRPFLLPLWPLSCCEFPTQESPNM